MKIDVARFERDLFHVIITSFEDSFNRQKDKINSYLKSKANVALFSSPEFRLCEFEGVLAAELGFKNITMISAIMKYISDSAIIEMLPRVGGLPDFKVTVFNGDYVSLLEHPMAEYLSKSKRPGSPFKIKWLDWLLTKGAGQVLSDFSILYGKYKLPPSRSRRAIMIDVPGASYSLVTSGRVSQAYTGTVEDNFVTRALEPILPEVVKYTWDTITDDL